MENQPIAMKVSDSAELKNQTRKTWWKNKNRKNATNSGPGDGENSKPDMPARKLKNRSINNTERSLRPVESSTTTASRANALYTEDGHAQKQSNKENVVEPSRSRITSSKKKKRHHKPKKQQLKPTSEPVQADKPIQTDFHPFVKSGTTVPKNGIVKVQPSTESGTIITDTPFTSVLNGGMQKDVQGQLPDSRFGKFRRNTVSIFMPQDDQGSKNGNISNLLAVPICSDQSFMCEATKRDQSSDSHESRKRSLSSPPKFTSSTTSTDLLFTAPCSNETLSNKAERDALSKLSLLQYSLPEVNVLVVVSGNQQLGVLIMRTSSKLQDERHFEQVKYLDTTKARIREVVEFYSRSCTHASHVTKDSTYTNSVIAEDYDEKLRSPVDSNTSLDRKVLDSLNKVEAGSHTRSVLVNRLNENISPIKSKLPRRYNVEVMYVPPHMRRAPSSIQVVNPQVDKSIPPHLRLLPRVDTKPLTQVQEGEKKSALAQKDLASQIADVHTTLISAETPIPPHLRMLPTIKHYSTAPVEQVNKVVKSTASSKVTDSKKRNDTAKVSQEPTIPVTRMKTIAEPPSSGDSVENKTRRIVRKEREMAAVTCGERAPPHLRYHTDAEFPYAKAVIGKRIASEEATNGVKASPKIKGRSTPSPTQKGPHKGMPILTRVAINQLQQELAPGEVLPMDVLAEDLSLVAGTEPSQNLSEVGSPRQKSEHQKSVDEQDYNKWRWYTEDQKVTNSKPERKVLNYELVAWDGLFNPAPVEWDARPAFNNNSRTHIKFMERWMNERVKEAMSQPFSVDITSTLFTSGQTPSSGTREPYQQYPPDCISARIPIHYGPINWGSIPCHPPNDPYSKLPEHVRQNAHGFSLDWCKKHFEGKRKEKEAKQMVQQAHREYKRQIASRPNPYAPKANIYVRPAQAVDIPHITRIYNYYVKNTLQAYEIEETDEAEWNRRWSNAEVERFAFLVAVQKTTGSPPATTSRDDRRGNNRGFGPAARRANQRQSPQPRDELVLGFIYAEDHAGRHSMFQHTVELQLFVDYAHIRLGIGRTLIDRMMPSLDPAYMSHCGTDFVKDDKVGYESGGVREVHKVMVNIGFHSGEDQELLWKKNWLEQKWDFDHVGTLPIGHKFNRGVNVAQMVFETNQSHGQSNWYPNEPARIPHRER